MEVFPAPCFMCGPDTDTRCQTGAEYCELFYPGIAAQPVQRTCRAMPTACRTTPTCSCLEAERVIGGVNTCQQAGAGELTVTFAAP
jgi:hypothetical protein